MRHVSCKGCVSKGMIVFFGAPQTSLDGSRRYAYVSEKCGVVGEGHLVPLFDIGSQTSLRLLIQAKLPSLPLPSAAATTSQDVEAWPRPAERSWKSRPTRCGFLCAAPAPTPTASTPIECQLPSQGDATVMESLVQLEPMPPDDGRQHDAEDSQADAELQPATTRVQQQADQFKQIMDIIAPDLKAGRAQPKADREQLKAVTERLIADCLMPMMKSMKPLMSMIDEHFSLDELGNLT